jgi:hypothetical protein
MAPVRHGYEEAMWRRPVRAGSICEVTEIKTREAQLTIHTRERSGNRSPRFPRAE